MLYNVEARGRRGGTLQEASCGWVTSIGIAATPMMFLAGKNNTCHRMIVPWFGILPLQVPFCAQRWHTPITCTPSVLVEATNIWDAGKCLLLQMALHGSTTFSKLLGVVIDTAF